MIHGNYKGEYYNLEGVGLQGGSVLGGFIAATKKRTTKSGCGLLGGHGMKLSQEKVRKTIILKKFLWTFDSCDLKSGDDVFDLIGDVDPTDEDGDIGMGDSTGVSASLDGKIFSRGKKCQESNIGDSDNTGDGGKIVSGAIGACSRGKGTSFDPSLAEFKTPLMCMILDMIHGSYKGKYYKLEGIGLQGGSVLVGFMVEAKKRTTRRGCGLLGGHGVKLRIKKGDPSNLKIPCMIGRKFIASAYIDLDLPMNIMSLAYYNAIRNQEYEHGWLNFAGIGKDMHVFVQNMSHVMDFTIFENVEAKTKLILNKEKRSIMFTDVMKEVTFKTPYKDPEMEELTSEGNDQLSSRVILSDDDFRRGCESPLDLKDIIYIDIDKLGPDYN
uniref:Protein kinase-like domain, concanavalin A-like lectin/glucanase domain protein n=1 Tax=Tanacetum cinerariifolium TaxID=118510 RepID=A0A6L2KWM5_TANCI|nr:protein kinase-like domain, concanavalin A-like lectin/glucanase domain protein [Tanacetum cinerariifolium]